jgi:hypothetical protein
MPTFNDPIVDAAEASEALRGLAHASGVFDRQTDRYRVLGDLSASIQHLHQIVEQVAANHEQRIPYAFDDAGRVAWHREPAQDTEEALDRQWVTVVFLQGREADQVLDIIQARGINAAVEHLAHWDYGQETDSDAVANGDLRDAIPAGGARQNCRIRLIHADLQPVHGQRRPPPPPHHDTSQTATSPPGPHQTELSAHRRNIRAVTSYEQPVRRSGADANRGLRL